MRKFFRYVLCWSIIVESVRRLWELWVLVFSAVVFALLTGGSS